MARILIVDDDPGLLGVLERMVARLGHQAIRAVNGKEALHRLQQTAVDLVITDLIMPETEGIETIGEIRKRWPDTRVIAMSGGGRQSPTPYLAVAASLGADATLAKPFLMADLTAAIDRVLPPPDGDTATPPRVH